MNTKREALERHQARGRVGTQSQNILDLLRESKAPLLREEIALRLRIKEASACARLNELENGGEVERADERLNPFTGHVCITYRIARKSAAVQASLFEVAA